MKIELKNVKYAAFASEETSCFTATVYIDGEKSGEASNDGHGGCNRYYPHDLESRLNAHAKTLPPMDCSYLYKDGEKHTMEHDADTIIDDLLDDYLVTRDVEKKVKKHVLYTRRDKPGIYMTKKCEPAAMTKLLGELSEANSELARKWGVDKVLNLLPLSEAKAIYRSAS